MQQMNTTIKEAVERISALATIVIEIEERESHQSKYDWSDENALQAGRHVLHANMNLIVELAKHSDHIIEILQIMYDKRKMQEFQRVNTLLGLDKWSVIETNQEGGCIVM